MELTVGNACPNCGSDMTGQYCAGCGQKQAATDLTLREFLHDATHELTNLEGKVPSTLKALFLHPRMLTVDFLAGRRARWLSPLRLYLICSVAYFVSKPVVEAITHRAAREVAQITLTNPNGTTTLTPEARREIDASLPGRIFGSERMVRAATNSKRLNQEIDSAFPKAMFVLLPFFAFLTSIAWRRKAPRYVTHLYPALHLHAAYFGAFTIATIAASFIESNAIGIVIALALFAYVVWYWLVALHRIFGDSWSKTVAKSVAIGLVYCCGLFVASLGLLAYAVFRV